MTASPESKRSSVVTAQTEGGQEIPPAIWSDSVSAVDAATADAASTYAGANRHWTNSVAIDITNVHSSVTASSRRRRRRAWSKLALYEILTD